MIRQTAVADVVGNERMRTEHGLLQRFYSCRRSRAVGL